MPATLLCYCAYSDIIPHAIKDAALRRLCEAGTDFIAVADLCERVAARDSAVAAVADQQGATVIACHERAVRKLLDFAGASAGGNPAVLNLRDADAVQLVEQLSVHHPSAGACSVCQCGCDCERPPQAPEASISASCSCECGCDCERPPQPLESSISKSPRLGVSASCSLRVVLYEGPAAMALTPERRFEVTRLLLSKGYGVERTGKMVAAGDRPLVLLGQFEQGTFGDEWAAASGIATVDLGRLSGEALLSALAEAVRAAGAESPGGWIPWFPVIDYRLCTGCGQCRNFCIFGVYAGGPDGRPMVAQPVKCKTLCPACARVCPVGAIIFPKHPDGPINGGAADGAATGGPEKVDLKARLKGDVYATLRSRGGGNGPVQSGGVKAGGAKP